MEERLDGKTVWKFQVDPMAGTIAMPVGAQIISTEEQHGCIVLYALVEPDTKTEQRKVAVVGTGHWAPDWVSTKNFIGTVKMMGGTLMFHVFAE